ncbi:MAG: hypothetical protein M0042_05345 [Nitrospiraceae bacterium]|nr:hypothetical protein [Nitrospiraceae bacterium]
MKKLIFTLLLLASLPLLIIVQYANAQSYTGGKHPVEVSAPPMCSQCHSDGRASMDHTSDFGSKRHKFYAGQDSRACAACHRDAFCSDCHAHKEELKPSDKYRDAPERTLPHRGDYLNQHKIDGRINPTSCYPCHGRQNNERCRVCHK